MAGRKKMDLTTGRPFGALFKFAIPVILGNLFQLFYTLADSVIGFCNRREDTRSRFSCGGRVNQHYYLFCALFYQWIYRWIWYLSGTALRCKRRARNAKEYRGINDFECCVCGSADCFVLCAFPSDHTLDENSGRYCSGGICIYVCRASRYRCDRILQYDLQYTACTGRDSKTPLYFLVFSSVLNIFLDILFILPLGMGVAGAAWATILSQFLSAVLSLLVGMRRFAVLHLRKADFANLGNAMVVHLKTGFPMGFQMSVMCIGQLAMQMVVNSLGTAAVAGYTAASKADQLSVLVNNAMMTAISNYVAQNFGAGKRERICQGVRASLIQTETFNVLMCAGIILLRHPIVELFMSNPTKEIYHYSDAYLTIVAPFYIVLGLLAVYRTAIQSMQNGWAPFAACMIELVMRISATVGLVGMLGYTSVCIASPMAWFGACALLIPCYYRMMKAWK